MGPYSTIETMTLLNGAGMPDGFEGFVPSKTPGVWVKWVGESNEILVHSSAEVFVAKLPWPMERVGDYLGGDIADVSIWRGPRRIAREWRCGQVILPIHPGVGELATGREWISNTAATKWCVAKIPWLDEVMTEDEFCDRMALEPEMEEYT